MSDLPADAITAEDTGDGVVIISCDEVPGLTLPVSIEAYREFVGAIAAQAAAAERTRIRYGHELRMGPYHLTCCFNEVDYRDVIGGAS